MKKSDNTEVENMEQCAFLFTAGGWSRERGRCRLVEGLWKTVCYCPEPECLVLYDTAIPFLDMKC